MRPLALLLLVSAVVLAPVAAAKSMAAPSPTVGDFWELTTKIDIPGQGVQEFDVKSTIAARESVTTDAGTFDTWRATSHYEGAFSASGLTLNMATDATSWVRASDGAIVKSTSKTTMTSDSPYFPGSTSESTTTWSEPCKQTDFPLDEGERWSATCTSTTTTTSSLAGTQTSTTTQTTNYTVLRSESVTVPAGTFDALVVQSEAGGNSTYSWWAPRSCGPVKTAFDAEGTQYSAQLKSWKCTNAGTLGGSTGGATTTTPTTTSPPTSTTVGTPATTTSTPPSSTAPTPGIPGPGVALVVVAVGAAAVLFARRR